jgi:hypothetical protein
VRPVTFLARPAAFLQEAADPALRVVASVCLVAEREHPVAHPRDSSARLRQAAHSVAAAVAARASAAAEKTQSAQSC